MALAPLPIEVEVEPAVELLVTWEDGHRSRYPVYYLRGFCPCASCQGHGGAWNFHHIDAPKLTAIEEVGSYALRLVWDDGGTTHDTGLYTFETLRELCPCAACRAAQGETHPTARMPAALAPPL